MTARNGGAPLRRPAWAACVLLALAGLAPVPVQAQDASLSINSSRVTEGDFGTAYLSFTVQLTPIQNQEVMVDWGDSGNGTATSGTDYVAVGSGVGTLRFAAGTNLRTITIVVNGDTVDEADETVEIALSNAIGATISTATGTGTIADDDTAALSIGSPRVTEGDSGTEDLTFTVTLDPVSDRQVTVDWAASGGGTAASGADYAAVTGGTLTFAPRDGTKTVTVVVNGDRVDEVDETVEITLSGATGGAEISTATGTGTIVDDDDASLSIDSPRANEGDGSATSTLTFTVTLDPVSDREVTVAWADSGGGTATSGADYAAVTGGTLTFAAGESEKTLAVTVNGDDAAEVHETVEIRLSGATGGAEIAIATGTGTIVDNDAFHLSIDSPRVAEGDSGTADLEFMVTLSPTSDREITVDWADSGGGTATSGTDYAAVAGGTLTFAPGDGAKTVTVAVNGDRVDETDETVEIRLSNATGGGLVATATGAGTIADDDTAALSIDSPRVAEGDSGTANLVFTVTLDPVSDRQVTVAWADSGGGTATSGTDYATVAGGTLTFAPGDTTKTVTVAVNGDAVDEVDKTVEITLSVATGGAEIATATGTGTIVDNDVPRFSIVAASVTEGDFGTAGLEFTVTLDPVSKTRATVAWTDSGGGTATSGTDYAAVTRGTLTFAVGESEKTVTVAVRGDEVVEGDETVEIALSDPTGGAEIATASATGTIVDDDAGALSIDSPGADEANAGETSALTFTVTLDPVSDREVTVVWADSGRGTAASVTDYGAIAGGTLTFAAGESEKTVTVVVNGDDVSELDETVEIALSDPTGGATFRRHRGTGTIRNDDDPATSGPSVRIGSTSVVEGDEGVSELRFPVRLSEEASAPVTVDYAVESADEADVTAAGTVTFAAGETEKTIVVAVRADEDVESDGLVVVTLGAVGGVGGYAVGTGRGIGIVRDDDRVLKAYAPPAGSVERLGEGRAATVAFTVVLVPPTGSGEDLATVAYVSVVDGTASVPEPLTFRPGEAERTVAVAVGGETEVVEFELADSTNALPEPGSGRAEYWLGAVPRVSVAAPPAGSVKRPAEGETAQIVFTVRLDRAWPRPEPVEVSYARIRDGDEISGTLVFEQGEREKTVAVAVDAETEAVTVTLTGATRVAVADDGRRARYDLGAERSGKRALALRHVLAAVGRTVAANVVETIWDRAASHRSGGAGSHATVAGRPLTAETLTSGGLARLLGVGGAEGRLASADGSDAFRELPLPGVRDLAGRTAFALPLAGDGNGGLGDGLAVWGRGAFTAIESGGLDAGDDRIGAFSSKGEVVAGHLGVDRRFGDGLLAGVAVSRAASDVGYAFEGGDGGGKVETTLTSAHPYVHWLSAAGLGVWGTVGYGTGSSRIADGDGAVGTDIVLRTVAAGVRDDLAPIGRVALALKADALHARLSADGVEGELLEVDADASRLRLALEGGARRSLADGGTLAGSFELGARFDGGDAERGAGADVALGFAYELPRGGLEMSGRGGLLLAHEESGFREWGLGLGLAWDPGVPGRGVRLLIAPAWRAPAGNAADGMWTADPGAADRFRGGDPGASLDARLGYGWGVLRDRVVATAFSEVGRSGEDDRIRLGMEFRLRGTAGPAVAFYGERRQDRERPGRTNDAIVLKGGISF